MPLVDEPRSHGEAGSGDVTIHLNGNGPTVISTVLIGSH